MGCGVAECNGTMSMAVSLKELVYAFDFANSDAGMYDNEAFLCRESGELYVRSDLFDDEELPDDLEDEEKYIRLANKRELDLGTPLVFAFIREFLPDDYDQVRDIFSRKGAYARYKDFFIAAAFSSNGMISRRRPKK